MESSSKESISKQNLILNQNTISNQNQNYPQLISYHDKIKNMVKSFFVGGRMFDSIFAKENLLRRTEYYLKKYNLKTEEMPKPNVFIHLNNKTIFYIIQMLCNLITISRKRNINFNIFSNNYLREDPQSYVVKSYNVEQLNNKENYLAYKKFEIMMTRNLKKEFDLIEEYEELYNKKLKIEKLEFCKNKIEEIAKEKGGEANIKLTSGTNPIKLGPGRRTRKKDSALIKSMRNNFAKTQKKEDLDRQKSNTMNTLETFFEDKNAKKINETLPYTKMDSEISFSQGNNMINNEGNIKGETNNKIVDNSEMTNTNLYDYNNNNEINIAVYRGNNVHYKERIGNGNNKRKVTLKDLIYFLENEMKLPLKMIILQKAYILSSQKIANN